MHKNVIKYAFTAIGGALGGVIGIRLLDRKRMTAERKKALKQKRIREKLAEMEREKAKKQIVEAEKVEVVAEPVAEPVTSEQLEIDIPFENDVDMMPIHEDAQEVLEHYIDKTKKYLPRAPYAITQDEFDSNTEYKKTVLTLYSDGTLVDDEGHEIGNPGKIVGNNILIQMESFGERTKYVRNEELNEDFEILKSDLEYPGEEEDDMK